MRHCHVKQPLDGAHVCDELADDCSLFLRRPSVTFDQQSTTTPPRDIIARSTVSCSLNYVIFPARHVIIDHKTTTTGPKQIGSRKRPPAASLTSPIPTLKQLRWLHIKHRIDYVIANVLERGEPVQRLL